MSETQRHKIIPAVYLILIKENQVFLARRYQTGYADGWYSLPAGHVDGNETFKQAMIREAAEEVAIEIKAEDLEVVHFINRLNTIENERLDVFFVAKNWSGNPIINEPDKCDDAKWCDINELPDNIVKPVKNAIELGLKKGVVYSEYWDNVPGKF
jgi:mutator protein MutT